MDGEADELRSEQERRARTEAAEAERADEPADAAAHARRAEKARYLEEQLDARRRSETTDSGKSEA